MAEEIDFENGHFRNFGDPVTLTLTSDDLGTHINRFVSLSPIHTYIVYMGRLSLNVNGRTEVRMRDHSWAAITSLVALRLVGCKEYG